MIEKNAIAYFSYRNSGCFWYRTKQPMEMLASKGIDIRKIYLETDSFGFDQTVKAMQFYGAYSFKAEKALKYLKENGVKIVYDADDALDLIDESNFTFYEIMKDKSSVNEVLEYADEITVSTPMMKKYMEGKTGKKITVIPNCYTPSEWMFPRPKREGFRIGFAGSATHVKDLIHIIPEIERLQSKYDVRFIIMGFGGKDYVEWHKNFRFKATESAKRDLIELDKRLSKIQFEWVEFVDFTNYPSTLINMALDIGICPLTNTPFNRCRSACKAMEYTLSGALALASDIEPYRDDKNSILVENDNWYSVIEGYINFPEFKEQRIKEHLEWTKANRNINSQYEALKSVYLDK